MLANFFGKSKPINTIVLTGLFLALLFLGVFTGKIELSWQVIPLFLFLLAVANFINSKNSLTFDNSFMFLFFILLLGVFHQSVRVNNTFFVNLMVLFFLRKAYSLRSKKNIFKKVFDAGFWLGIAFVLEPFSVIFALLLYVSLFLFERLNIQTLLISLLGFVVPVFLYFTYCFWFDKIEDFNQLFLWYTLYDFSVYNQLSYQLPYCFVGLCVLLAVFAKTPKALAVKNTFRSSWLLVLLNFVLALTLIILVREKDGSELTYILFPTAVILANGLELINKKMISNVVVVLFTIASLISVIA